MFLRMVLVFIWTLSVADYAYAESLHDDGAIGSWHLFSEIDPMTDDKNVVAVNEAESGQNNFGQSVNLVIGCNDKEIKIMINWGELVGIGDNQLKIRWEPNKPETETYSSSPDGESTFLYDQNDDFKITLNDPSFPNNYWAEGSPLMDLIRVTEKVGGDLVVEITPDTESPIEVVFDLKGAAQAEKAVEAACGPDAP